LATIDVVMQEAAYGRLMRSPSRVTQKIFAVLLEWCHHIVKLSVGSRKKRKKK